LTVNHHRFAEKHCTITLPIGGYFGNRILDTLEKYSSKNFQNVYLVTESKASLEVIGLHLSHENLFPLPIEIKYLLTAHI